MSSGKASDFVREHDLHDPKAKLERYKGKFFEYKGEWDRALEHYTKAVGLITDTSEYKGNPFVLQEYLGFLAKAKIKKGSVEEEIGMANDAFEKMLEKNNAFDIRDNAPGVWGIWASGILLGAGEALLGTEDPNMDLIKEWLTKVEEVIKEVEEKNVNIAFRRQQLEKLKQKLGS